jgi:glutamate-1-semialdehyde 2,1-aminomutase
MTTPIEKKYLSLNQKSNILYQKAHSALPGASTRSGIVFTPFPYYISRGSGCRVYDIDNNERIDFLNNFTSYILGHNHPSVVKAIVEQSGKLMGVAAPTELEIELAEEIKKRVPSIELIRFCNSGTEATMSCMRVARMFTRREIIVRISGSYHGSHDYSSVSELSDSNPDFGIPTGVINSICFIPFNDIPTSQKILDSISRNIAAVIIESVMGAGVLIATQPYLKFLREFTRKNGSLLIFDEVITLQVAYNGAQGRFGIVPDLTSLGKIIGGGLPVGAFGGRNDIMQLYNPRSNRPIPHGGTFNANPLTMAAGLATLRELSVETLKRLETDTVFFCDELRKVFKQEGIPVCINQIGALFNIHFSEREISTPSDMNDYVNVFRKVQFHMAASNRGIMIALRGLGCLSTVMTRQDLTEAVNRIRLAIQDLKETERQQNSKSSL